MAATKKQRAGLSTGVFLLSQIGMAAYHEGAISVIVGCGLTYAAWKVAGEIFDGDNISGGSTSPQPAKRQSLAYRLLTPKSARVQSYVSTDEEAEYQEPFSGRRGYSKLDGDMQAPDLAPPPALLTGGSFLFSDVLATGFSPNPERLFLGMLPDGTAVFCPVEALCHVALAGATDAGKSSIMRMLMAQLCAVNAVVLLLNPHYTGYILGKKEDWTPFIPHLTYDPMKCKEYPVIEHFLRETAEVLIPKRLHLYAQSKPVGRPHFIVIDELPAIVKKIAKAPDYLDTILKEGRKVGVYLISAAQDFLVKTIGGTGAVRDCYRTAYYVGGDDRTAKVLLDTTPPQDNLGKGVVYLRNASAKSVQKAQLAYVPFTDNEALYELLGPSTYTPDEEGDASGINLEIADLGRVDDYDLTDMGDDTESAIRGARYAGVEDVLREPEATIAPILPDKGRKAEEIDPKMAIEIWNAGYNSKRKLMAVFGITDHQALKLMEIIGVKEK